MNDPGTIQAITAQSLLECQRSGADVRLIDVSTPVEYREVHVPFAENLPIDSSAFRAFMGARSGGNPRRLYVMCRGGVRSVKVCKQYPDLNLVNVEGGTKAWKEAMLPLAGDKKVVTLERQVRIAAGALTLLGAILGFFAHPYFIGISGFVGAGLLFAGVTNTCGMALLLAKMPWNNMSGRQTPAVDHKESYSH